MDSKLRSIAKAISYRVLILSTDSLIVYFITHRADVTLWVVFLTNLGSTGLYYLHERFWDHAGWGRGHAS